MKICNLKSIISLLLILIICVCCIIFSSGCNNINSVYNEATDDIAMSQKFSDFASYDEAKNIETVLASLGIDAVASGIVYNIKYDENDVGFQLDMPKNGDTIAVINTSLGDITIRFFPEQAPKTVTNFINLANAGAYNNTTFYKVIDDFIVQAGNANMTSSYGGEFEDEFCDKLFNIRGAVSMANNGCNTNTSQFFINQKNSKAFEDDGGWNSLEQNWNNAKAQLISYKDSNLFSSFINQYGQTCYDIELVSDDVKKLYEENGGTPYLDGAYNALGRGNTVFGQVIHGMTVVDKIASIETDENDVPKQDITVKSVKIKTYTE